MVVTNEWQSYIRWLYKAQFLQRYPSTPNKCSTSSWYQPSFVMKRIQISPSRMDSFTMVEVGRSTTSARYLPHYPTFVRMLNFVSETKLHEKRILDSGMSSFSIRISPSTSSKVLWVNVRSLRQNPPRCLPRVLDLSRTKFQRTPRLELPTHHLNFPQHRALLV
jgi:hypothetical protein